MALGLCVVALICAGQVTACRAHEAAPEPPGTANRNDGTPWFVDATADTGLAFRHVNGMSGQFYHPEILAPGVALFDYDNDGDLDVFLIQGGPLRSAGTPSASRGPAPGGPFGAHRLNGPTTGKGRL